MAELRGKLATIWSGPVDRQAPLSEFTTFGVGGAAEALIVPSTIDELVTLVKGMAELHIPWQVIGRGSNLLVSDQGVSGVVLLMAKNLSKISLVDDIGVADSVIVKVEAGCSIASLLNWLAREGLSGLEFLAGVPGSLGGAVVMNAGAVGQEISEFVVSLDMLAGEGRLYSLELSKSQFQYRCWLGDQGDIIVCCFLRLTRANGTVIKKRCLENIALRGENQPKAASAGSFFKNPPGDYAGRLIEAVGLKGVKVGGAQVSSIHANFIINSGSATASDILSLMQLVQDTVKKETGVWLEPEVKILGV